MTPRPPVTKQEVRDRLLVRRRARSPEERVAAGEAIASHLLAAPELTAGRVAAYVSVGTEPPTDVLLAALRRRGVQVLLPVLLPDLDLAWGEYAGHESLVDGLRGTRQPSGPALNPAAVADVDVLMCPGLAVDSSGLRLGRGGGSYDRALARLPDGVWSCVLLYPDEVLDDDVPADPHDRRVDAAATPDGMVRFSSAAPVRS